MMSVGCEAVHSIDGSLVGISVGVGLVTDGTPGVDSVSDSSDSELEIEESLDDSGSVLSVDVLVSSGEPITDSSFFR